MAPQPENRTVRTRNAFTLVELLVVIVIIALLAALLMPVLNGAYRTAMKSADAALINQISMGNEAYNQVFHEYVPSVWGTPAELWPPPPIPNGGTSANVLPLTGSAKIFAALSGFKTIAPVGATGVNATGCSGSDPTQWRYPCGELTYRGIIVDTNPTDGNFSEDKVYGPYYNPDEKGQTKTTVPWGTFVGPTALQQTVFASRFARQTVPTLPTNGVPETGAPILYYRAAPSPTASAASGVIHSWDIFAYEDNYMITNPGKALLPPVDRWKHPLYAPIDGLDPTIPPVPGPQYYDANGDGQRDYGISKRIDPTETNIDPNNAANKFPRIPYNANTYILISPGPDGEYFTADDVTNYKQ